MRTRFQIEVTIADGCNKHCSYCFEGSKKFVVNPEEEKRQLDLIVNACETLDKERYSGIHISFWGGEPFLNPQFMLRILENTAKYDFVDYHVYTNATLTETIKTFFSNDIVKSVYNRFHVQISYDGEPHHTIMRGYPSIDVLSVADYLKSIGIHFDFKATLSFSMLDKLPEIWDDYCSLYDRYDGLIRYGTTLDTTYVANNDDELFGVWKSSLWKLAKKEYKFFIEHGHFLTNLFDGSGKRLCDVNDSVFMSYNGLMYVCHGCPYTSQKDSFITGATKDIKSLYDVMNSGFDVRRPVECEICGASYCAVCHCTRIQDNDDIKRSWSSCITRQRGNCKYFKYLGYVQKLLDIAILEKCRENTILSNTDIAE